MADEEKKEEGGGEEKKKGGNTVLIIVVVVLVLLLIVGGVVAFLLMSSDDEESGDDKSNGKNTQQSQKKTSKKSAQRNLEALTVGPMYTLDKFQVNLLSNSGKRFLVTELRLEMESEEVLPELDTKKAVIRDHIISILSSKNIEEVSTPKGKDKLKDEIVSDVNSFLADGEIKNVYFTKFVMQ